MVNLETGILKNPLATLYNSLVFNNFCSFLHFLFLLHNLIFFNIQLPFHTLYKYLYYFVRTYVVARDQKMIFFASPESMWFNGCQLISHNLLTL
jgi:hypothetical protein